MNREKEFSSLHPRDSPWLLVLFILKSHTEGKAYISQINTSISVVHLSRNSYVKNQHAEIHKREKVLIFYIISNIQTELRVFSIC